MDTLHVKNFGPIREANVSFGDLTFIIGEQASGKSLFLELLKLGIDRTEIIETLRHYNFILKEGYPERLLDYYFGEGLSALWSEQTSVALDGYTIERARLLDTGREQESRSNNRAKNKLFYIPAQRILSLDDGRPKSFTEFNQSSTPYVLRDFSETLRLFLQVGVDEQGEIYPRKNRIKGRIKQGFDNHIFHMGRIIMEDVSGQQKMKLTIGETKLPFLAWSAGQKEFAPLLLAMCCLTGPAIPIIQSQNYTYVVIEEPEMGLHAAAIRAVLLQILDLVSQGKRVVVSTHSTIFLEFAWVFQQVKSSPEAVDLLFRLFGFELNSSKSMRELFAKLLGKQVKTYLFHREKDLVVARDISPLDAFSEFAGESYWGGLLAFADRANEVVARAHTED